MLSGAAGAARGTDGASSALAAAMQMSGLIILSKKGSLPAIWQCLFVELSLTM